MFLPPLRKLALLLLLLLTGVIPAAADTLTVTSTNTSGPGSLLQAIADAQPGDTITFNLPDPGPWAITVTTNSFVLNKNLTILGPGPANLTLRTDQGGSRVFRGVFQVNGGVTATIQGVTITQGVNDGGGILNYGTLTVNNCLITNNFAFNWGGGIQNQGTLIVTNSAIVGNGTGGNGSSTGGGGLYNIGTAILTNCTLTGNNSSAIYNRGTLTVSDCTLAGNPGDSVQNGGIRNDGGGTVNSKNSLLADNSGGNLINSGAFNVAGVNFSTDGTCPGFTQVTSAQLNLDSLADNGGPTPTIALLAGSIAIDAAADGSDWSGNPIPTDQRGIPRPRGAGFDVGAFELLQNQPPVANAGPDQNVTVPHDGDPNTNTAAVTLDGSASSDPDGDPLTYQWTDQNNKVVGSTATPTVNLTAGTYTITLVVTDPFGASSASDSVKVTVNPEPNRDPTANAGPDQTITTRDFVTPVQLDGSGSSDPDGDTLNYFWTDQNGNPVANTAKPTLNVSRGVNTFTLYVADPYDATYVSTDTVTITVTPPNHPPIAQDDSATIVKNNAAPIPVIANDSDPDGDPFDIVSTTAPAHGTADINHDGTITYTPATDYTGIDSFTYTIQDQFGATATATVSITILSGDTQVLVMDDLGRQFSGAPGQTVTLQGTLQRLGDNAGLPFRVLRFRVDGNDAGIAITTSTGKGQVNYTIPGNLGAGMHALTVEFPGDGTYNPSLGAGTLTIQQTGTHFSIPPNKAGALGQAIILNTKLRRNSDNVVLPGESVTFLVDGNPIGSAVTGSDGVASLRYTIPVNATVGAHPTQVQFAGNPSYNASSDPGTLTVQPGATHFSILPSKTGSVGQRVVLYARLRRNADEAALAGERITFQVDGRSIGSAVTDATGTAAIGYVIPANATLGAHPTVAQFAGDANDTGCTGNGTLTVNP